MADKKKKPDDAMSRARYAAYRKEMAKSPDTIIDTLTYAVWKKSKGIVNEPEK